jgi:hypothetical protein
LRQRSLAVTITINPGHLLRAVIRPGRFPFAVLFPEP